MLNTALKGERDLVRTTETAEEIVERTKVREIQLSRLLAGYVSRRLAWCPSAVAAPRKVSRPPGYKSRTRAGVGLDRDVHPGHWLLFHSQIAGRNEAISRFVPRARRIHCG
jgi:hypothetical protein